MTLPITPYNVSHNTRPHHLSNHFPSIKLTIQSPTSPFFPTSIQSLSTSHSPPPHTRPIHFRKPIAITSPHSPNRIEYPIPIKNGNEVKIRNGRFISGTPPPNMKFTFSNNRNRSFTNEFQPLLYPLSRKQGASPKNTSYSIQKQHNIIGKISSNLKQTKQIYTQLITPNNTHPQINALHVPTTKSKTSTQLNTQIKSQLTAVAIKQHRAAKLIQQQFRNYIYKRNKIPLIESIEEINLDDKLKSMELNIQKWMATRKTYQNSIITIQNFWRMIKAKDKLKDLKEKKRAAVLLKVEQESNKRNSKFNRQISDRLLGTKRRQMMRRFNNQLNKSKTLVKEERKIINFISTLEPNLFLKVKGAIVKLQRLFRAKNKKLNLSVGTKSSKSHKQNFTFQDESLKLHQKIVNNLNLQRKSKSKVKKDNLKPTFKNQPSIETLCLRKTKSTVNPKHFLMREIRFQKDSMNHSFSEISSLSKYAMTEDFELHQETIEKSNLMQQIANEFEDDNRLKFFKINITHPKSDHTEHTMTEEMAEPLDDHLSVYTKIYESIQKEKEIKRKHTASKIQLTMGSCPSTPDGRSSRVSNFNKRKSIITRRVSKCNPKTRGIKKTSQFKTSITPSIASSTSKTFSEEKEPSQVDVFYQEKPLFKPHKALIQGMENSKMNEVIWSDSSDSSDSKNIDKSQEEENLILKLGEINFFVDDPLYFRKMKKMKELKKNKKISNIHAFIQNKKKPQYAEPLQKVLFQQSNAKLKSSQLPNKSYKYNMMSSYISNASQSRKKINDNLMPKSIYFRQPYLISKDGSPSNYKKKKSSKNVYPQIKLNTKSSYPDPYSSDEVHIPGFDSIRIPLSTISSSKPSVLSPSTYEKSKNYPILASKSPMNNQSPHQQKGLTRVMEFGASASIVNLYSSSEVSKPNPLTSMAKNNQLKKSNLQSQFQKNTYFRRDSSNSQIATPSSIAEKLGMLSLSSHTSKGDPNILQYTQQIAMQGGSINSHSGGSVSSHKSFFKFGLEDLFDDKEIKKSAEKENKKSQEVSSQKENDKNTIKEEEDEEEKDLPKQQNSNTKLAHSKDIFLFKDKNKKRKKKIIGSFKNLISKFAHDPAMSQSKTSQDVETNFLRSKRKSWFMKNNSSQSPTKEKIRGSKSKFAYNQEEQKDFDANLIKSVFSQTPDQTSYVQKIENKDVENVDEELDNDSLTSERSASGASDTEKEHSIQISSQFYDQMNQYQSLFKNISKFLNNKAEGKNSFARLRGHGSLSKHSMKTNASRKYSTISIMKSPKSPFPSESDFSVLDITHKNIPQKKKRRVKILNIDEVIAFGDSKMGKSNNPKIKKCKELISSLPPELQEAINQFRCKYANFLDEQNNSLEESIESSKDSHLLRKSQSLDTFVKENSISAKRKKMQMSIASSIFDIQEKEMESPKGNISNHQINDENILRFDFTQSNQPLQSPYFKSPIEGITSTSPLNFTFTNLSHPLSAQTYHKKEKNEEIKKVEPFTIRVSQAFPELFKIIKSQRKAKYESEKKRDKNSYDCSKHNNDFQTRQMRNNHELLENNKDKMPLQTKFLTVKKILPKKNSGKTNGKILPTPYKISFKKSPASNGYASKKDESTNTIQDNEKKEDENLQNSNVPDLEQLKNDLINLRIENERIMRSTFRHYFPKIES